MRKDRFEWSGNDVKFTPSQCSDCVNNTGKQNCIVYKKKPDVYAINKEKCPSYDKEK